MESVPLAFSTGRNSPLTRRSWREVFLGINLQAQDRRAFPLGGEIIILTPSAACCRAPVTGACLEAPERTLSGV